MSESKGSSIRRERRDNQEYLVSWEKNRGKCLKEVILRSSIWMHRRISNKDHVYRVCPSIISIDWTVGPLIGYSILNAYHMPHDSYVWSNNITIQCNWNTHSWSIVLQIIYHRKLVDFLCRDSDNLDFYLYSSNGIDAQYLTQMKWCIGKCCHHSTAILE